MIVRKHSDSGTASEAVYSDCERYRFLLRRDWGAGDRLLYILLNPSTATEERNDPTIERCERRARAAGYGGFAVANIFAYRATDPAVLKRASEPVGPDTDALILRAAREAAMVLCGWGVHGEHLRRGAEVEFLLRTAGLRLWHLGVTRDGHPRHPLYIAYAKAPETWSA